MHIVKLPHLDSSMAAFRPSPLPRVNLPLLLLLIFCLLLLLLFLPLFFSSSSFPLPMTRYVQVSEGVFSLFVVHDRRGGRRDTRFLLLANRKPTMLCKHDEAGQTRTTWYELAGDSACDQSDYRTPQYRLYYLECALAHGLAMSSWTEPLESIGIFDSRRGGRTDLSVDYDVQLRDELDPIYEFDYAICTWLPDGKPKPSPFELVQFFEVAREIGAQIVTLIHDPREINEDIRIVLDYYADENLLDSMPFWLPLPGLDHLARSAAINQCVARHSKSTKWLAIHELDRVIVVTGGGRVHDGIGRITFSHIVSSFRVLLGDIEEGSSKDEQARCVVRPDQIYEQTVSYTRHAFLASTPVHELGDTLQLRVERLANAVVNVTKSIDDVIRILDISS